MVSMLAFNSDNPSLNPAEAYSFSVKFVFEKNENRQKEAGLAHFFKKTSEDIKIDLLFELLTLTIHELGGSPGLVVMGGDSRSKGCGFESWHRILDGHDIFSHWFAVKIVLFV